MAEAFKLMLTGMSTVFLILIFVVLLGHLIIMVTNKLNNNVVPVVATKNNQRISSPKMAAILAAVEVATQGRGNIKSINKIEEK
jgi:Na+-transporting methylmalonyl-CoA/oxaloacetate decarboxylase gamma subunit